MEGSLGDLVNEEGSAIDMPIDSQIIHKLNEDLESTKDENNKNQPGPPES